MPYRNLISCHVSDAVRDSFYALARSRELTAASLLRQMIVREIADPRDHAAEQRSQILFLAIAMDGLLAAHSDPELRPRLVRLWQERIAREEQSDAA